MPNNRRRLTGRVVSDKMDKTVVVAVQTTGQHPLYGKIVRTTKKYLAHDESNAIPVGSTVRIVESRPLSKHKRWMVEEVVIEITEAAAEAAAIEAQRPEVQEVAAELLEEAEAEVPQAGDEE
jgi:small subunit ribosomal protein S17